jgi:hypothetical protein
MVSDLIRNHVTVFKREIEGMVNWSACIAAVLAVSGNGVMESGNQESTVVGSGVSVTVTAADEPAQEGAEKPAATGEESSAAPAELPAQTGEQKRIEVRVQSRREDGKAGQAPKVVTQGRIVVVGPDGIRREYDLNDAEGRAVILKMDGGTDALAELESLSGRAAEAAENVAPQQTEERMVIGVICEEASQLLRRHLKLENAGLVVIGVSEGRPAAEAGIEVDDVLVSVNDQRILTREQLVELVTNADGKPLQVTLLRDGEPRTIAVTPRKMAVPVEGFMSATSQFMLPPEFRQMMESGRLVPGQLIHPGVIVEGAVPASPTDLQKMLQSLRSEAEAATATQPADLAEQLEKLRSEVQKLHEEVQRLQNK